MIKKLYWADGSNKSVVAEYINANSIGHTFTIKCIPWGDSKETSSTLVELKKRGLLDIAFLGSGRSMTIYKISCHFDRDSREIKPKKKKAPDYKTEQEHRHIKQCAASLNLAKHFGGIAGHI